MILNPNYYKKLEGTYFIFFFVQILQEQKNQYQAMLISLFYYNSIRQCILYVNVK